MPAIRGLVSRLSRFTHREYIGGHWFDRGGNKIPSTLLWTAARAGRHPARAQNPSTWSWTSFIGEISFHNARSDIRATLQRYEASGESALGMSIALHIRGKVGAFSVPQDTDGSSRFAPIFRHSVPGSRQRDPVGNITFDRVASKPLATVRCL